MAVTGARTREQATGPLAQDLAASFRRDGFVQVKGQIGAASVASTVAYRDTLCERLGLAPSSALVAAPPGDAYLSGLADSAALAGLAATLLGAQVSCFGATYLDKAPGSGLPARWHQDLGPWRERLAGAPALTLWVALSDADESNGCLEVLPGSHVLPTFPLRPDAGESLFGVAMDPALVDEDAARRIGVQAGDVVAHHPNLIHGSLPNRSARRRLALALRYRAAEA